MFWLKVDHAADTAARRAVEQTVCPFKDFNALQHLRVHHLTRHDARQTAHRHVVAVELKAANAIGFSEVTEALNSLHARVVADYVGKGFRLLILHRFRGVTDDVKRHVHRLLFAEHAKTPAVGHLAVEIRRYQRVATGGKPAVRRLNHDGVFRSLLSLAFGGCAVCDGTDGQRKQSLTPRCRTVHDHLYGK